MDELTFHVPTQVHFGLDILNRAGQIASRLGTRALVAADGVLAEYGVLKTIVGYLKRAGVESILFDELGTRSTSSSIEQGLELCRASRADLIVGVGGLRALSIAKCIARMTHVDAPFDDYLSGPRALSGAETSLRYLEIPTTCRNPFMLTDQ